MFYASTDWTENAFASLPVNLDVGQRIGTEDIIKHYDNINLRLYRLECWKMKNENPEEECVDGIMFSYDMMKACAKHVKSSTTKDHKGMLLIRFPCEYT